MKDYRQGAERGREGEKRDTGGKGGGNSALVVEG